MSTWPSAWTSGSKKMLSARSTGVRGPFGRGPGRSRPDARVRTGRAGARPSYRRAGCGVSRWLRPHTPSRSARTGRRAEEAARPGACRAAGRPARPSGGSRGPPENAFDFVEQRWEPELARAGRSDEDDVAPGRGAERITVEDRLDAPAHAVADDRAPDGRADGDPDPRATPAGGDEAGQVGPGATLPAPGHAREVAAAAQRVVRPHGLNSQAVAALLAARGKDATAILRGHPFEEAVDALAAPIVRLIGPLHERVLLSGGAEAGPGATRQYTGPAR